MPRTALRVLWHRGHGLSVLGLLQTEAHRAAETGGESQTNKPVKVAVALCCCPGPLLLHAAAAKLLAIISSNVLNCLMKSFYPAFSYI